MPYDHISLLTDYGTADEFVGVMKAVIADLAPHARITDLAHHVPAYDVRAGSLMLARCIQYVPRGIVIGVVDPGVGTQRKAIALEIAGGEGILLGPDNGLLAPAAGMVGGVDRAVVLNNVALHLPAPGATFAGRDIFAPVAAHLCSGVPFDELGDAVDADLLMPGLVTLPQIGDTEIISEVTWVDHFGNCQLNVGLEDVATLLSGGSLLLSLVVDGVARSATITTAFGLIPSGGIGLVIDSYGMLAIAKDQDSAARDVGVGVGDQVVLRAGEASQVSTAVHIRKKNASK
jgi:S-adenosylmethionine hydrolase